MNEITIPPQIVKNMIIGRNFIERMYSGCNEYEDTRLYSTGDDYLDELLERAFCEGYEYAQKEFTTLDAAGNVRRNNGSLAMTAQQFNNAPRVMRAGNKAFVYEKPTLKKAPVRGVDIINSKASAEVWRRNLEKKRSLANELRQTRPMVKNPNLDMKQKYNGIPKTTSSFGNTTVSAPGISGIKYN